MSHQPSIDSYHCAALDILELPSYLQIDLFTKWVHLKDIAILDSALCSTISRKPFLNAWKQQHCVFANHSADHIRLSESFAAWVAKRDVRIACEVIFGDEEVLEPALDDFFATTSSTVRKLGYSEMMAMNSRFGTVDAFVKKACACSELTTLILVKVPLRDGDLREVLTKCTKLKTLKLMLADSVDLMAVHQCGRKLESLEMEYYRPNSETDFHPGADLRKVQIENSGTLKKIVFLEGHKYGDWWDFLINFIGVNGGLRELHVDCLSWFDITDVIQNCLQLTTLRADLDLRESQEGLGSVYDIPFLIENAKSIRYLQLGNQRTEFVMEAQILKLIQNCPHYVMLSLCDMQYDMWLDKERALPTPVQTASPTTSGLQALHLHTLSIAALREVLMLCPHLTELGLLQPVELDRTVSLIVTYRVRRLHLKLAAPQTCSALLALSGLDFLHLFHCAELTGEDVIVIVRNNPDLTHLRLINCKKLNARYVIEIVQACPKLQTLYMSNGYDNLDGECEKLRSFSPSLKNVHLAIKPYRNI
jgi:hypothetical protein